MDTNSSQTTTDMKADATLATFEGAKRFFTALSVSNEQKNAITTIETRFIDLLQIIYKEVPVGANRAAAVRKLWEAKTTVVEAIAKDWH